MKRAKLTAHAKRDLKEAARYYEAQRAGLGEDFLAEYASAVKRLLAYPHAFPVLDDDVRKFSLRRFPYAIYYVDLSAHVQVVAVMHLHRHPDAWKHRP